MPTTDRSAVGTVNMNNTKLSFDYSVVDYERFKKKGDTKKLAALIYDRFNERFVQPFEHNPYKHGFCIMAICCLMIEALHSFKKGWKRTGTGRGSGAAAFEAFFSESTHLKEFTGHGDSFYKNIRCGLLHQGETCGGWKIRRTGHMIDVDGRTINAYKFLDALKNELADYRKTLEEQRSIKTTVWRKAIRKLDYIVKNTEYITQTSPDPSRGG